MYFGESIAVCSMYKFTPVIFDWYNGDLDSIHTLIHKDIIIQF